MPTYERIIEPSLVISYSEMAEKFGEIARESLRIGEPGTDLSQWDVRKDADGILYKFRVVKGAGKNKSLGYLVWPEGERMAVEAALRLTYLVEVRRGCSLPQFREPAAVKLRMEVLRTLGLEGDTPMKFSFNSTAGDLKPASFAESSIAVRAIVFVVLSDENRYNAATRNLVF